MTTEGAQAATKFLLNALFLHLGRGHTVFKRRICVVHTPLYALSISQ